MGYVWSLGKKLELVKSLEGVILVDKQDQVFVISPIGDEGTPIRNRADVIADYIVTPIAKEFDLKVDRSDRDPTPGPITSSILRSLLDSRVVLADLTGRNPNVYYELCFAHSFGLPVVSLIDKAENLPFDLKNERVISLGDEGSIDMQKGEVAKNRLREAFTVVLKEDYQPNSLVNEVAGVQNIESMSPQDPVASELQIIKQRVDEIHAAVGKIARPRRNTYKQADLKSLQSFVESLLANASLSTEQVDKLITESTSDPFDHWVITVKSAYKERIAEADAPDIPF